MPMKAPMVWVAATLTAAIVLTVSSLVATGTRDENPNGSGEPMTLRVSRTAK
jgi:hypothetical protein